MRAGELRQKVRIESRVETQSADGQITITWSTFATVRASIEPFKGTEFIQAQSVNEKMTARIWIRYISSMDTDMRMVDVATGDVYDIISLVNNDRRNRRIECIVEQLNDKAA